MSRDRRRDATPIGEPAAATVGWCAPDVARELPDLRLLSSEVQLSSSCLRSSPAAVRERLAALSDRYNGAKAIALRREAVPAAYRAFFREIGLDPDTTRTPIEAAVFWRMFDGGFVPTNLLDDTLLIGLIDTAVAVWALDADSLVGELGVRTSRAGEVLGHDDPVARGEAPRRLDAGQLVVADSATAVSVLGEAPVSSVRPRRSSRRVRLYALQVDGIPSLAVDEALWVVGSALEAQR